uniref:Immunoglobulin subtype domain-containing protein n=1 Tax=Sinocyclocheilus rhinocerous TaxID=307959 RepID=A0A673IB12_9TELE
MYKSQFRKIDPYDWFCAPGSHFMMTITENREKDHMYFSVLNAYYTLFFFFFFAETSPTLKVGIKGGNVTLPCQYDGSEIPEIDLSGSENIPVCQTEECSCRVCKKGACDVVIKDLSFSDAGTYNLRVYYRNDQTELEQQIRTYQLCVDGKDHKTSHKGQFCEIEIYASSES